MQIYTELLALLRGSVQNFIIFLPSLRSACMERAPKHRVRSTVSSRLHWPGTSSRIPTGGDHGSMPWDSFQDPCGFSLGPRGSPFNAAGPLIRSGGRR